MTALREFTMLRFARMVPVVVMTWLVCLGISAGRAAAQGQVFAGHLKCESLKNPIGLGNPQPRLTWVLSSDFRDQQQSAYRVLVASSPALLDQDNGDLWDSGKVASRETAHVPYEGAPLASRQRCFWKVMTWDGVGNPGPWSDTGTWEMGLLDAHDWQAKWIDATPAPLKIEIVAATYRPVNAAEGVDVLDRVQAMLAKGEAVRASNDAMGGDPAYGTPKVLELDYVFNDEQRRLVVKENATAQLPSSLPYLRKSFRISEQVTSSRLYVTALGVYEISLNGQRIGDHHFAPGWTDYRERVQYQTFDVTDHLAPGANTLGAIVGPGWFSGRAGLFHARAFYGTSPALLAQLEITLADGSTRIITSDDTWQRHDGPILAADMMDGEVHDARMELPGWCDAGAAETTVGWSPVTTREETRHLVAQPDQPVRVLAELPARAMHEPEPGRFVFDVGQNMVGVARLRIRQPVGTRLTLRHAEMLNPDGTLYTANLRGAAATDEYTCRGGGEEIWQPKFTFHGFRYVEVSGLTQAPHQHAVTGIVLGTDLPIVGEFSCSDERLNQLQSNIVWGMRGNMLSIPTDCPQRDERMGWTADTQVFVPTAAYNADIGPFMAKWMQDVRDAQREDGAHSDVAPVMKGLNYGTPVWGDAGTIVPWAIYSFTGDTTILQDNFDSMRAWVDWCEAHSTGLIRDRDRGNDYGDWLSIGADTPKDLIGTAYFARSAWIVAETARVLGERDVEAKYRDLFERIRAAFIARYVREDGSIKGDTQTCSLVALRFDLLPATLREKTVGHLVADLEQRGWRLSTGFVGVSHLLPVLDEAGRSDVAYRLLLQDEFPSWLFSVKHGATTIWERWNGWTPDKGMNDPGMNSFNHFALGSCGEWLFAGVAGIRLLPDAPGFARFEISPRTNGPLTHARARYRSVRGEIASAWEIEEPAGGEHAAPRFSLQVTIPTNTRALVRVPGSRVLESGKPLPQAEGVRVVRVAGGETVLDVGSGEYLFTSILPPR